MTELYKFVDESLGVLTKLKSFNISLMDDQQHTQNCDAFRRIVDEKSNPGFKLFLDYCGGYDVNSKNAKIFEKFDHQVVITI